MRKSARISRPGLFWGLALSLSLALAAALLPLANAAKAAQYTQKDIPDLIELSKSNFVLSYDNYQGYFIFEAKGDQGGHAKMHLHFNGFYLYPVLTLSMAKQGIIPYSPQYKDIYQIIPMSITANVSSNLTRHCVSPVGQIYSNFKGSFSDAFPIPAPPNWESSDGSLPRWAHQVISKFWNDRLRFSIRVESKQPDGGQALMNIDAYALFNCIRTTPNGTREMKRKIYFTQDDRRREPHLSVNSANVSWRLPGRMVVAEKFSIEDISLSHSGSDETPWDHCGPGYTQKSDQSWHFSYRFSIAAKKEIKAKLTAVDRDAEGYLPKPGDVRRFKLTLEDPGPEEVQAVRFTLENVSSHPGIATNAGNHIRSQVCGDCTTGRDVQIVFRDTQFSGVDNRPQTLRRSYVHYNACALDSKPDVFFSERENPDYDLSEDGDNHQLQYTISPKAKLDPMENQTAEVRVTVMDGAATGRIRAEVRVAGLWYPAKAEGPSAGPNGTYLWLVKDGDGDGMADAWQKEHGSPAAGDDLDSLTGNHHPGDGLTAFEEYRGVYIQGNHQRLDPRVMDFFVHDYSRCFGDSLETVKGIYQSQGLRMWLLNQDEFLDDIVNYQTVEHRGGDQYNLVVMELGQCPGLDMTDAQGLAYVSPPNQQHNTAVIDRLIMSHASLEELLGGKPQRSTQQTLAGVLAHELGHNLNMDHHGEGEGILERMLKSSGGKKVKASYYVACLGGEHSGAKNCIMRYNCADKFLDQNFVPQSFITRIAQQVWSRLKNYDKSEYGAENTICSGAAGGGVCGDARKGNCRSQLTVKSY